MKVDDTRHDHRLLFLAATAKDATTTEAMLSPLGIRLDVCRTFEALLAGVAAGAGAILLPEEAASPAHNAALRHGLGVAAAMVRPSGVAPDTPGRGFRRLE